MSAAMITAAAVTTATHQHSLAPSLWFVLALVGMPFWFYSFTKNPRSNTAHVFYALYCMVLFPIAIWLAS